MSKEHELPSDSDEDDEDYVPDGGEIVSEVESEGEAESGPEEENNDNLRVSKKKSGKRGKSGKKSMTKKRKVEPEDKVDNNDDDNDYDGKEKKNVLTEEEEKKKADSLWADFMSDTGTVFKPKSQKIPSESQENLPVVRPKVVEKVKITKVFEFAGEEVQVEKEVYKDSAEGRLTLSTNSEKSSNETISTAQKRGSRGRVGGLGGISSVLGQIGKKTKISTLEKSKLDWDSFKKQENLDEEINTHNKGKDGYLERQDFLQRADLRQFEIEKKLRTTVRRSNR